jgi:transposase
MACMTRSEARSAKRNEVVEAIVIRGEPVAVVARVYNIALRTVFGWLARYRSGGWEALQEDSRKGRPRKVSGSDLEWLYEA